MSKINPDMGDLKQNEAFYIIMYILDETICRNIWCGDNIFPSKLHEDIFYDIETKHA
jgi:hypothetical protein